MALADLASLLAPPDLGPHEALPIAAAVRAELVTYDAKRAATPAGIRLSQELVSVAGFATAPDGERGPATIRQLKAFQTARGLPATGTFDEATWRALVRPIVQACALPSVGGTPAGAAHQARALVVAAARQHALAKAREISPNLGPWVRLYMAGNQGAQWAWCAGFDTFVWIQAAAALGPDALQAARAYRTFSCDALGSTAKRLGTMIDGADVVRGKAVVRPGDLFLVQSASRSWDYTHTGVVTAVHADGTVSTVEGNTNAAGGREGLFVLERVRRVTALLDFVRCPFADA